MARVGFIACTVPRCGTPDAAVSKTGTGTLSVSCHRCQYSGYAKPGTKAHRLVSAAMTLDDDAAPAPAPAPAAAAPKAAPAPPPKAKSPAAPPAAAAGSGLLIG